MKKAGLIAGALAVGMIAVGILDGKRNMKRDEAKTPVDGIDPRRFAVLEAARGEIGIQDPQKYWADVLPEHPGFNGDWCGGFALWAIRQAGIAPNIHWEIGKGFCYRLPITHDPKPGDVAYFDKPYQHHAIVESVGEYMVTTIDGNQPGSQVVRRTRPLDKVTAFYSIDPLLNESDTSRARA